MGTLIQLVWSQDTFVIAGTRAKVNPVPMSPPRSFETQVNAWGQDAQADYSRIYSELENQIPNGANALCINTEAFSSVTTEKGTYRPVRVSYYYARI